MTSELPPISAEQYKQCLEALHQRLDVWITDFKFLIEESDVEQYDVSRVNAVSRAEEARFWISQHFQLEAIKALEKAN